MSFKDDLAECTNEELDRVLKDLVEGPRFTSVEGHTLEELYKRWNELRQVQPVGSGEPQLKTPFQKEIRYTVLKNKDIEHALANGFVREDEVVLFNDFCHKVFDARADRKGSPGFECVVVESDWRCHPTVWDLVEAEHIVNESAK